MEEKIKLGISSCLLGNKVRWNGDHSRDHFLTEVLGPYVEYVPVCPEAEIGLGIPREPLRLVGREATPRLVFRESGEDVTDRMVEWAKKRLDGLEKEGLCGYIFKSKSPSSGMERIKVYNEKGNIQHRKGVGVFAQAFMERFPLLPVEEEGRLQDIDLRENFIVRVFTCFRFRQLLRENPTVGGLVAFHTRNKYLYMAHHPQIARQMGKIVAKAKEIPLEEMFDNYLEMQTACLKHKATVKKHANVLYHMMGYFKKELRDLEKEELTETIENYRLGLIPLIVPVTLIRHYVRLYDQYYLKDQYYLEPHPLELKLRNHA